MSKKESKPKEKSKNDTSEKQKADSISNSITDSNQKKKDKKGKKKDDDSKKSPKKDEDPKNGNNNEEEEEVINVKLFRKRRNSVSLYKKKKKERDKEKEKEKSMNTKHSTKNIKTIKLDNIYDINEKNTKVNVKRSKSSRNIKGKKVTFQNPNFVTIIDVESYKKYNENTCKDPFGNFLNYYSEILNSNNDDDEDDDGKERVRCSCFIF